MPEQNVAGAVYSDGANGVLASDGPGDLTRLTVDERQLHLLDQVIGLRAQLAEEIVRNQVRLFKLNEEHERTLEALHQARLADAGLRTDLTAALTERDQAQADLHSVLQADADLRVKLGDMDARLSTALAELVGLKESWTWRAGRVATGPAAAARRVTRRFRSS